MSARKLLSLALLAGLLTSVAACSDMTGPKTNGVCQVTSGGSTCID
jgi:hypothetical protein